ncbi:acyltransferase family protein [Collinsella sp. An2]|uniref:acyltransferase family protein n=1 Tax=Collinsella sp. An2 TaxID=1965585 RepID=UPI000B3991E8|nr:acyltransferase family protein [Collinsella sp. An2]OUP10066.1 hypothetical protein B5F33_03135 [Collinsella sp. An2]
MRQRLQYIDIARGVAMLCIISGHLGITSINSIVYTFHVPLFFLLSGYVFSRKQESWGSYIQKRAKQLLVPYIVGCFGIALFTVVWFTVQGNTADIPQRLFHILRASLWGAGTPHTYPVEVVQIGALWFLPAQFVGMIVLRFALSTACPLLVVLIGASVAYLSGGYIWLPMSVQPGLVAAAFLYIGYWVKLHKVSWLEHPHPLGVLASLMVWGVCHSFGYSVNIVSLSFIGGPLCVVNALCGSYLVIVFSLGIERTIRGPVARFLSYFGQVTLAVLIFHAIADFTFPWYLVYGFLDGIGVWHPLQNALVIMLNVLWPLLGIAMLGFVPRLKRILIPRNPIPYQPASAASTELVD